MKRRPLRLMGLTLISALVCAPMGVALGQDQASGSREEAAIFDDVEGEEVDQDVDSDIRQEGGEKVKVFRFSGLDLAGRLKSPQLLYFLNRMRAEFDRPRLPHRSFIPELQRSAHGKAFR
ncbi:MAG: hypothetical protein EVA89_35250 [Sandaracinaceae bacterium]|nr:MAG: hypothetical protein EVA89_35250 [Sandaracinaceae bacterium]